MAARWSSFMCFVVAAAILMMPISAQLSSNFYDDLCPDALPAIRSVVEKAIKREARMGASLLRLHFHDCFVNGCDGSVLLDDTPTFIGEKTAVGNNNSIRGFDVVDEIKEAVNTACCGNVVSCADILAVAARDSVEILGGSSYEVLLGRRDARTASLLDANNSLPARFFNFSTLLSNFEGHGLDLHDLVVLSGSHTIGKSRCVQFRDRIYNDTNIVPKLAASLRKICPREGGDDNLSDLDDTPETFDTKYFKQLRKQRGLLHTDQELFKNNGTESDRLVKYYSKHPKAFAKDFGVAMIKMGNIKPLTGSAGEIRMDCRKIN